MEGKQSIYTGKMRHQELSNSKPAGIKTWWAILLRKAWNQSIPMLSISAGAMNNTRKCWWTLITSTLSKTTLTLWIRIWLTLQAKSPIFCTNKDPNKTLTWKPSLELNIHTKNSTQTKLITKYSLEKTVMTLVLLTRGLLHQKRTWCSPLQMITPTRAETARGLVPIPSRCCCWQAQKTK